MMTSYNTPAQQAFIDLVTRVKALEKNVMSVAQGDQGLALLQANPRASIIFSGAEVLRLDANGFHYMGRTIEDAGEAHRLFTEWINKNSEARISDLEAKLEAAERDLAHALKVAAVAEGMAKQGEAQAAKLAEALDKIWAHGCRCIGDCDCDLRLAPKMRVIACNALAAYREGK